MASESRFLQLVLWGNGDTWSTEDYNANLRKIDDQFNPNVVSTNVMPDDINGLSSIEIDDLFQQTPRNGTIRLVEDNGSYVIITRIGGAWYKTANLTAVDA